jgi:hypothetical protein
MCPIKEANETPALLGPTWIKDGKHIGLLPLYERRRGHSTLPNLFFQLPKSPAPPPSRACADLKIPLRKAA